MNPRSAETMLAGSELRSFSPRLLVVIEMRAGRHSSSSSKSREMKTKREGRRPSNSELRSSSKDKPHSNSGDNRWMLNVQHSNSRNNKSAQYVSSKDKPLSNSGDNRWTLNVQHSSNNELPNNSSVKLSSNSECKVSV
jgi:hypothetical protein